MSRGRQKVSFEGLMQENVLGTFKIIRGFADLRDLVTVSVAMLYQGSQTGQNVGYQRQLDDQHVEDLKRFLSRGRYRFFPEIVLGLPARELPIRSSRMQKDVRHPTTRLTAFR